MTDRLRIALAQINPHEGALDRNAARIRAARAEAAALGADLLVTPEFSIAGYPPEDLVLKPAFVEACMARIEALAAETADGGPGLVVGGPWRDGERLHNALFVLDGGKILARRAKHELPNYGVFDDKRVFTAGPAKCVGSKHFGPGRYFDGRRYSARRVCPICCCPAIGAFVCRHATGGSGYTSRRLSHSRRRCAERFCAPALTAAGAGYAHAGIRTRARERRCYR